MKLEINEKFWGRADYLGRNDDTEVEGSLADSRGKMCCLGFVGQACGITKKDMRGLKMPHNLEDVTKMQEAYPWLFRDGVGSNSAYILATINDSTSLTLAEKRKQIKAIFKKHGVDVVFRRA